MSIFNEIVAGFIGFLVVVLGGGGSADVSTNAGVSATATSSVVLEDEGFIEGLRDSLLHLQARLQASSDVSSSDDDAALDSGHEDEDRGRDAEGEQARGEDGEESIIDISGKRDDDSEEGENEDEDTHGGSVQVEAGVGVSGSGGSGSSASGSVTGSTATTFTMSEIAKHDTSVSCYTAINGSVYDLTKWIPQHPGGQSAIKGLCGVDGSAAFNGQHGGAQQQAQVLATFKIGVLAQ